MNHATQDLKDNLLGSPVSATVMGSGRVRAALSAETASVADAGRASRTGSTSRRGRRGGAVVQLRNIDTAPHHYVISGGGPGIRTSVRARRASRSRQRQLVLGRPRSFDLAAQRSRPSGSGSASTRRRSPRPSRSSVGTTSTRTSTATSGSPRPAAARRGHLHVPWHVAPLAASSNGLSKSSLDLTRRLGHDADDERARAPGTPTATSTCSAATTPLESHGEEDVVAVGARSFTGYGAARRRRRGRPERHRRVRRDRLAGLPGRPEPAR